MSYGLVAFMPLISTRFFFPSTTRYDNFHGLFGWVRAIMTRLVAGTDWFKAF